ncbi:MAG: mechanosensitive ion channel family protein [Thermoplasmatales archaeon]|nr:mechanosensitive ion channel family protein [Thermoplasmatales archaeon]
MRFPKGVLTMAVAVAVAALLLPGLSADDSSGAVENVDGVSITFDEAQLEDSVESEKALSLVFYLYNTGGTPKVINVSVGQNAKYTTSSVAPGGPINVDGGKTVPVKVTITADRYSKTGDYPASITFKSVSNPSETHTFDVTVKVVSAYDSESRYNTLLGLIKNPLPEPFDTAPWAALLSFVIWIVVAGAVMFVVLHVIFGQILLRKNRDVADDLRHDVRNPLMFAMALMGLSLSMSIAGVSQHYVGITVRFSEVLYLVIGAIVGWRLYKVLVSEFLKNQKKNIVEEFNVFDETLIPLFHLLGKIAIGTTATAAILAVLGFNLMAILTGAGIMGIALSLGAQSTLNQFFSGLNLLMTRPFNPGDRIRLGTDETVLIVRKVGIMNTTFESWYNAEVFSMPNSKVVDSTIVNITSENSVYKIMVFFNLAFDADLDLAKEIMLEAAMEHPRVIKDGSFETPKTRVMSVDENGVRIRLSAYIDDFEDYGVFAGELREAVLKKFRREGIAIPYRRLDVRTFRETPVGLEGTQGWPARADGADGGFGDGDSENGY